MEMKTLDTIATNDLNFRGLNQKLECISCILDMQIAFYPYVVFIGTVAEHLGHVDIGHME